MNTIGELIDTLLNSEMDCTWLSMVCRHTDQETMAQFRALPIVEQNVLIFCQTVASQIRSYLASVYTEEHFESIHKEGREFFEGVWNLVKDFGFSKTSVCVPISYTDMAVEAGVVQVEDGMVSLTEVGETMAENLKSPE